MVYTQCPFFSDEVIEVGEWRHDNYDRPFGEHCCSCKEIDCDHNPL